MQTYDVVIVGAGVAGALIADSLAGKGLSVLLLESGPQLPSRAQLMENYWANPIKTPDSPYPDSPYSPRPVNKNPRGYFVQQGPELFTANYERMAGGTTWHWLGTSLRLIPSDFAMKSLYGVAVDWPISYADLEPWYQKAEIELGVAGDASTHTIAPRSTPFPKRPIAMSYLDKKFQEALKGKNYIDKTLTVSATPQARDPDICQGSRSCIPLCPTGAKYEARRHVERAQEKGARLIVEAVACHIAHNSDGKITSVQYRRWDKSQETAVGKQYVIAANAVETAKLLLMSRQEGSPNGLANRSDQVGRNLMDHPIQLSWAASKEVLYPYRGPVSTAGIENLRDGSFRKTRSAYRIEIHNDGWVWPTGGGEHAVQELINQGFYGKQLRELLRKECNTHVCLSSLAEQLPDPQNRVTLSDQKDAFGIPRPAIQYSFDDYLHKGLNSAREAHDFIFQSLGVTASFHSDQIPSAGHLIGTYRMGSNPKESVVDRDQRSHDHPNLFLVGSGVFPTAGSANPTLSIAALCLRTAELIAAS